jgi:type IV pilus assembly protein PilQ
VENGGTVVLGGIFEDQEQNSETRVPLLGEIPGIRHLFRQTQRVTDQRELMIFITPRIASEELTLNK